MSKDKRTDAMKQNFLNEKTPFEKFEEKLKMTIFGVLFVLLKNSEGNFWVEMFQYIWKKKNLQSSIITFLGYSNFVVFFMDNPQMYIVMFYFLVTLVMLVIIDIVYVSIVFSQNKIGAVWPIRILRSVVSYIVTILFMPIVEFFMAVLECSNTDSVTGQPLGYYQNNNINGLYCWEGTYFVHATFAVLTSVIFCGICVVVQMIFYEIKTNVHCESAKTNSKADLFTLILKICCIILYSFLIYIKNLHWIVIIMTFVLSAMQFWVYYTERPFYEEKVLKAFLLYAGVFCWNNAVLLLGKILENSEFDGCIELFFIGIPIIIWIILTMKDNRYSLLLTSLNKIEKGDMIEKQVRYFLELVDKRDTDRESKLLLKGYVYHHVETCSLLDCPLKKYLNELTPQTTQDAVAFLYEHAQTMFQLAISKFPTCTSLRKTYAFFLLERFTNKKQSILELKNAEKHGPTFEEQFIIYRLNKLIEEQSNEEEEGNLDIVSNIAYKNHLSQFKQGVADATCLYTELWALLLRTSSSGEDLEKMNDYGSKISHEVEEINSNFDKMQKLKPNDFEVVQMYSEFLHDILNEKEKSIFYKNRINEMEDTNDEYDIHANANFDVNNMPNNDDYQYIVLSADIQNVGVISKVSTGICPLFGYAKEELIGKPVDFIMPEQYHVAHKTILQEKINEHKKIMALSIFHDHDNEHNKALKTKTKELFVFGKNKSRYLVPMSMKVSLMLTHDKSQVFFTAKVTPNDLISYNTQINTIDGKSKICYVLTNKYFIVQNFTPNSMSILGFNPNTPGNMDITKWIKDFSEDFYQLEMEDKTVEQVMFAKRQMVNSKYKTPTKVAWITAVFDGANSEMNHTNSISTFKKLPSGNLSTDGKGKKQNSNSGVINKTPIMRNIYKDQPFLLSTTDIFLLGATEGFIFKFESIYKDNISEGRTDANYKFNVQFTNTEENVNSTRQRKFSSNSGDSNMFKGRESIKNSTPLIDMFKIDKEFKPDNPVHFHLDTQNLTYVANPQNLTDLKQFSKIEAEKKFLKIKALDRPVVTENEANPQTPSGRKKKRQKHDESGTSISDSSCSSYDSEEGDGSSYESSSSQQLSEFRSDTISSNEQFKKNILAKTVIPHKRNEHYYQVNMSTIIFFVYNYEKQKIIQVPDNDRLSQVEFKKTEDFKKDQKSEILKKEVMKKKELVKEVDLGQDEENSNFTSNELILMKEIGYALSKVETQPEIIRMRWISFFNFLLLIAITSIFLALFVNNQTEFLEILKLIVNSNKLIANSVVGVFYTRELVLLNNPKYTNYLQIDKASSIQNVTQSLLNIFSDNHDVLSTVTESTMIIGNATSKTESDENLYEQRMMVELLEDKLSVKLIELSLTSALVEANTALYHISNDVIDNLYPTNENVFFYMRNFLNALLSALQKCAKIYIEEVFQRVTEKANQFNYGLISVSVFCIVFFISIKISHSMVVQRKESYLEVFFEIESDVIRKSIDKCEKFTQKISTDDTSDDQSILEEEDDESKNKKQEEEEAEEEKKEEKERDNANSGEKRKTGKSNAETRIITIRIIVGLLGIFVYFLVISFFYYSYLDTFSGYCDFYNITANEQGYYLLAFSILREYFFDSNTTVHYKDIDFVINDFLTTNYEFKFQREQTIEQYYNTLPAAFQVVYNKMQNSDMCYLAGDLFDNILSKKGITCQNFISNTTSFGFNILLTNFIEEIRVSKLKNDLLMSNRNPAYSYNNTLYKSNYANESSFTNLNSEDYVDNDPFQIFNDQLVRNLGFLSIYLIQPAFDKILGDLNTSIVSYVNTFGTIYMAAFVIFITACFGIYLFVWRPFEHFLNQTIFKTKNMLAIVPKEVLANLPNIHKILNIGKNFAKTGKKDKRKNKNKEELNFY